MVDESRRAFLRGAPVAAGAALAAPALLSSLPKNHAPVPDMGGGLVFGEEPVGLKGLIRKAKEGQHSSRIKRLLDMQDQLRARYERTRYRPRLQADIEACRSIQPWAKDLIQLQRDNIYSAQIDRIGDIIGVLRKRMNNPLGWRELTPSKLVPDNTSIWDGMDTDG